WKWGLPGGFLDRDGTLVEGVLRELREEAGWKGRLLTLLRINSRPDRRTMIGKTSRSTSSSSRSRSGASPVPSRRTCRGARWIRSSRSISRSITSIKCPSTSTFVDAWLDGTAQEDSAKKLILAALIAKLASPPTAVLAQTQPEETVIGEVQSVDPSGTQT